MKKIVVDTVSKITALFCLSILLLNQADASFDPRVFSWGLTGREDIARFDALIPLYDSNSSLTYTDLQAKTATDNTWNTGIGVGYRAINTNKMLGGYLFLDRNVSDQNKLFYLLNPGFEFVHYDGWEFRINGYIPVSKRFQKNAVSDEFNDTCGQNHQCDQTFFVGHQQFFQPIRPFQEVGPGADAEIGKKITGLHGLTLYGGGYYYNLQQEANITGAEGRVVLPVNNTLALTAEASYDNQQRGTFIAGVRLLIGKNPRYQSFNDHLYDPIIRNLGANKTGASTPIISGKKFEQPILVRDNIYFFTSKGGVAFAGAKTGTFENPLANNQFIQSTVDSINVIAPNANFFFNPGSYIINFGSLSAPNASIQLHAGQSLHGRTEDYKCSASLPNLPKLLGEIELLEGNNWLDSISIFDSVVLPVGGANLVAVSIQDADNILICNSMITAKIFDMNNNVDEEFTTGINANNSTVRIIDSIINSEVIVQRNNIGGMLGRILVVGIGGNNTDFSGNQFDIIHSQINSRAKIAIDNFGFNFATGIGENVRGTTTENFTDNIFHISSSIITVTAETRLGGTNFAAGIGGANGQMGNVAFDSNVFDLYQTQLTCIARANNNNNNSSNFATSIGGNSRNLSNLMFTNNVFNLNNSELASFAIVALANNQGNNASAGIGSNAYLASAMSDFTQNTISLNFTHLQSSAIVGGNNIASGGGLGSNSATGIGSTTARATTSADFDHNNIAIQNSVLDVLAQVGNNTAATSLNHATGIGCDPFVTAPATAVFTFNNVNAVNSTFNVTARILGINSGSNLAIGFKADTGTVMNIVSSNGSILALASGLTNAELEVENGGTVTFIDSSFIVFP